MKDNIVCSGALFYATSTKRFLFLQRTDKKTQGMWGLVGGKSKFTRVAFEGLKREDRGRDGQSTQVQESYSIRNVYLKRSEVFLPHVSVAIEQNLFLNLMKNIQGYCWTAFECWPKNLHMGLKNTLNNKSIKGKLQTILDLIV